MDAAEREKIKAMCAALMPQAKKAERPEPPKKQKPQPVAIGGHSSRAGAGSAYGAFVRSRNVGKCPTCSARVELPCRACHVRLLMQVGMVPPLYLPQTKDGRNGNSTHRQ